MNSIFEARTSDTQLTSHAGFDMVGSLLMRSHLGTYVASIDPASHPGRTPAKSVMHAMVAVMSVAKPDYAAIDTYRDDPWFGKALHLDVIPSQETFRQRMEQLAGACVADASPTQRAAADAQCDRCEAMVRKAGVKLLVDMKIMPTALTTGAGALIPIDMDPSPFDQSGSKREGSGWTYKKHDGYTPMLSYLGREGYAIDAELRCGPDHSQNGTVGSLARVRDAAMQICGTESRFLFRLDSGCDAVVNRAVIESRSGDFYIISRNRHREWDDATWLEYVKKQGASCEQPRPGKKIWTGSRMIVDADDTKRRLVYRFTERTSDAHGQQLIETQYDLHQVWTNLSDTDADVLKLYADHGTSEQFHSEYKTDLNAERFASGDFNVNRVLMCLTALTAIILRLIGKHALRLLPTDAKHPNHRKDVSRLRLRTVIDDLIRIAARIIHSGRRWIIDLGKPSFWTKTWIALHAELKQT